MKTLQIKVTGKKTGQTGYFELTVDDQSHPDGGRWHQSGGTLQIIGARGVVGSGTVTFDWPHASSLTWMGASGMDGGLMEFLRVAPEHFRKECDSPKGDGVIFMPSVPSRIGVSGGTVKETMTWEIILPACGTH